MAPAPLVQAVLLLPAFLVVGADIFSVQHVLQTVKLVTMQIQAQTPAKVCLFWLSCRC